MAIAVGLRAAGWRKKAMRSKPLVVGYASRSTLVIEQGELRRGEIGRRLRRAGGLGPIVWGDAGAGGISVEAQLGVAGFDSEHSGLTFGQEFGASTWRVGVAQTYGEDTQDAPARQSASSAQTWTGSACGSAALGRFRLSAIGSYSQQKSRLSRAILIGPPLESA